ncbi:MAG: hypothetical protein JW836_11300 [Deltaproteobacteria bacterium]|nr:hypothetical protein [Deltaproteobacteria bacterium]
MRPHVYLRLVKDRDFVTQEFETGKDMTYLPPDLTFYRSFRRETFRDIQGLPVRRTQTGLHKAVYRRRRAEMWNSRYGIPAALARRSL